MITFEEIYAENHVTMFRVARKMIGDGDAVSDILQDVFTDLFQKLKNGNDILRPKSWLYRATCNKCIDRIRRKRHLADLSAAVNYPVEQEPIENQDIRIAVRAALSCLNPRERMLAVLYSEGMSYKEMAEATGIKPASIGKKLSRTLGKIEKEFKDQGYVLY